MVGRIGRRTAVAAGTAALAMGVRHAAAASAAGQVESVTGDATAARSAASPRKLAPQEDVFVGDLITTQVQSTLDLLLGTATRIRLGPETQFRIDRFVVNAGGILVLDRGAMLYDHDPKHGADAVSVRSPFGLVAVRGTRFFAGPTKGEFSVVVMRGEVTVTGANTFVTLTAGQGTGIAKAGMEPSPSVTWGKPRMAEAMGRIGLN